jgi:hypothetical protein
MFTHEMTEKTSGKVEIKDTTPKEFGDFLKTISPKPEHPTRTLYRWNKFLFYINQITASNVFALLKLADRYDCKSLRNTCEEHLLNCVEVPMVKLLACAKDYGLDKLKVLFCNLAIKGFF